MAGKMNPDLVRERSNATFDVNELAVFMAGGKNNFNRKKYIENLVYNNEEFNGPHYHFMERSDLYTEGIRKTTLMVKTIRDHKLKDEQDLEWLKDAVFPNENNPTSLHTTMFLHALLGQANAEQQDRWLKKALNFEIIGTYAQTELGHGTFLRGLETTAVYDENTESFIINSPKLTSIKWWPGALGKTANCAIVMADLHTRGKRHGMHAFMVELRDIETHQPKPGITLGDIGPKFGYGMLDNGFLKLDNVRVHRTNMLMKNAQVLKNGVYMKAKHAKLGYGTMIYSRMKIASVAAEGLAEAAVITTRYSCVRHQSELKPGTPEPQVIDYQTQQYKVFPELAASYAFNFAAKYIARVYETVNRQIQQGQLQRLPELHALSSCLKALSSFHAQKAIETLRLACGGHGYSQASGIPKIYVRTVPTCTFEGENTVLYLQTARFLVKMFEASKTGQHLSESVSYLSQTRGFCSIDENLTHGSLVSAFSHRAFRLIQQASARLSRLQASGMEHYQAWNASSVLLVKAAEAHGQCFVVKNFVDVLGTVTSPPVADVLDDLCRLYAVHLLLEFAGDFMEDGYMSAQQISIARESEIKLLARIRPNAVAIADAFGFHDRLLQSELGRYDGNVYENLYKWACDSPLNRQEVHDSFNKYMKPFQQASKL